MAAREAEAEQARRHHRQAGSSDSQVALLALLLGLFVIGIGVGGTELLAVVRGFTARMDVEAVRTMVLRYRADFNALPGDDPRAADRWQRPPAGTLLEGGHLADRTGNGRWDGRFMEPGHELAEAYAAWSDLEAAGLWVPAEEQTGRVGLGRVPRNAFGGVMVFGSDVLGLRNAVCLTQVPGDRAAAIDARLDDGVAETGEVRLAVPDSGWTTPLFNQSLRQTGLSFDPESEMLVCAEVDRH